MSKKTQEHHGRIYRDEYQKQVSMYELSSPPAHKDILQQHDDVTKMHGSQNNFAPEQFTSRKCKHMYVGEANGYIGRQRAWSEKHMRSRDKERPHQKAANIENYNSNYTKPSLDKKRADNDYHKSNIRPKGHVNNTQTNPIRSSKIVDTTIPQTEKRGRKISRNSSKNRKTVNKHVDQANNNCDIIRVATDEHHTYRTRSNTESIAKTNETPFIEKVDRSVSETDLVIKGKTSKSGSMTKMDNEQSILKEEISRKTNLASSRDGIHKQTSVKHNNGHDLLTRAGSDKINRHPHTKSSESITIFQDGQRTQDSRNDNGLFINADDLYGYNKNEKKKSRHDKRRSRHSSASSRKSGSENVSRGPKLGSYLGGFDLDTNDPKYLKFKKSVKQSFGRYNHERTDQSNDGVLAKWGRRCTILSLLVVTVVVLLGVITGLLIVFVFPEDLHLSPGLHDMSRAHVTLRIINRDYRAAMSRNSSDEFRNISIPFCNEIDNRFLSSILKNGYYGCHTRVLSTGSVQLYYTSPFLDTHTTSNATLIREILLGHHTRSGNTQESDSTMMIGEFLVDVTSINITIEKYQTKQLPQKPTLHGMAQSATPAFTTKVTTFRTRTSRTTSTMPSMSSTTSSSSSTESTISGFANVSTESSVVSGSSLSTTFKHDNVSTGPSLKSSTTIITLASGQPIPVSTRKSTMMTNIRPITSSPGIGVSLTTPVPHVTRPSVMTTDSPVFTSTPHSGNNKDVTPQTTRGLSTPGLTIHVSEEVHLLEEAASVTCTVTNFKGIERINIYHSHTNDSRTTTVELREYDLHTQWLRQGRSKYLNVVRGGSVITVGVNFTSVTCEDTGNYTCEVRAGEVHISASGYLHGKAPPDRPHLNLPVALIEGREIAITCTANVGFPPGTIRWQIKPKGVSRFIPFEDQILSSSGACNNFVTSSIIYTPTRDGNGTLLKCLVDSETMGKGRDLTTVSELQILPSGLCDGVPINNTLRHPFTCTMYVRCLGDHYDVIQCKNNLCYDAASGQCGHTAISMTSVVAYLNEGVTSLKCRLIHTGHWTQITVSKVKADGNMEPILTSTSNLQTTLYDTAMKDRLFVDIEVKTQFEVEVKFWVYVLACEDQGEYICQTDPADYGGMATGSIELKVKPEAPKITVPHEIIEDFPLRSDITCTADVGYPYGNLKWTIKAGNETQFYPLTYNVTSEIEDNNCSRVMTLSFHFTPTLSHNDVKIRCELENTATLPRGHKLVAMETIHVIPGNFCTTHEDAVPQVHPYDCHQYVQCADGYTYVQRCGSKYCFNPDTLRCDAAPEIVPHEVDPQHPCRPNSNGVFLPHPFLCNKFIWCVQGSEIIQHCPMGTLYIDGGQCTFDPNQSRCYKDTW